MTEATQTAGPMAWDFEGRIRVRSLTTLDPAKGSQDTQEVSEEMGALLLAIQRTLENCGYAVEGGIVLTRKLKAGNEPMKPLKAASANEDI